MTDAVNVAKQLKTCAVSVGNQRLGVTRNKFPTWITLNARHTVNLKEDFLPQTYRKDEEE